MIKESFPKIDKSDKKVLAWNLVCYDHMISDAGLESLNSLNVLGHMTFMFLTWNDSVPVNYLGISKYHYNQ